MAYNYSDVPDLATALADHPESYRALLPLLDHSSNPEDPVRLLASSFLTNLVSASLSSPLSKTAPKDEHALPRLYSYLSTLTKSPDTGLQDIGVQQCSSLLRTKRSREMFWNQRNVTVEPLTDILRSAGGSTKDNGSTTLGEPASARSVETGIGGGVGIQLLYHVLLVMWQLSFEGELVGDELES
jgi:V-type H+-transporting ATPase subunit H